MVQFTPQVEQVSVEAQITYSKPPPQGEKAFRRLYKVPEGQKSTNYESEQFSVAVTDIRSVNPFTLTRNGFQLEQLRNASDVQWDNEEQVRSFSETFTGWPCLC